MRLTPLAAPMQRWNRQLKHASPTRTSPRPSQSLRDVPPGQDAIFDFVSRVFAPAPGSAAQTRVGNSNFTTPFAKPQGCATRVGRTLAAPRLRQSLTAFGLRLRAKRKNKAIAVAGKTKFRIPHFHLPPGHSCAQDPHVMLDMPDQDVGTGSG